LINFCVPAPKLDGWSRNGTPAFRESARQHANGRRTTINIGLKAQAAKMLDAGWPMK